MSNETSATIGTLPACLHPCCSETNNEPFHPTDDEIKRTSVKQYTGEGKSSSERTCPSSIFLKYTWVTYYMTRGTIACFFCKKANQHNLITFSNNGEGAFFSDEFGNWKKCKEKLKKHSKSKFHLNAIRKVLCFDSTKSDIAAALISQLKESQETRRRMLMKQLSTFRCLACQGMNVQGKTDVESNLFQILKMRAEDIPELMDWIKDGKYLSHYIINELINMMGNEVLTTTDLSIHEDFLGMYQLEKTVAETITSSLKDILMRCNLKIDDCRWYDGAANMAGCLSGVAARILSENPLALYVHCANHSLDVKASEIIRDILDLVQDLAVFIRSSPTQMAQYQHIASDLDDNNTYILNPHLLCLPDPMDNKN